MFKYVCVVLALPHANPHLGIYFELNNLFLQHIKTSEFRICLKELFADQHDPVTVSYVVLAGKGNYA